MMELPRRFFDAGQGLGRRRSSSDGECRACGPSDARLAPATGADLSRTKPSGVSSHPTKNSRTRRARSPFPFPPSRASASIGRGDARGRSWPSGSRSRVARRFDIARGLSPLAAEAAVYRDSNRVVMLDNQFRLPPPRVVTRRAAATLSDWRRAWDALGDTTARGRAVNVRYEVYPARRAAPGGQRDRLRRRLRARLPGAVRASGRSDSGAGGADLHRAALPAPAVPVGGGTSSTDRAEGRITTVAVADAVAWLRGVQAAETYADVARLAPPLIREDDIRRYVIERVSRSGRHGAMVRHDSGGRARGRPGSPALLQFTIYADTTPLLGDCGGTRRTSRPPSSDSPAGRRAAPTRPCRMCTTAPTRRR